MLILEEMYELRPFIDSNGIKWLEESYTYYDGRSYYFKYSLDEKLSVIADPLEYEGLNGEISSLGSRENIEAIYQYLINPNSTYTLKDE